MFYPENKVLISFHPPGKESWEDNTAKPMVKPSHQYKIEVKIASLWGAGEWINLRLSGALQITYFNLKEENCPC